MTVSKRDVSVSLTCIQYPFHGIRISIPSDESALVLQSQDSRTEQREWVNESEMRVPCLLPAFTVSLSPARMAGITRLFVCDVGTQRQLLLLSAEPNNCLFMCFSV